MSDISNHSGLDEDLFPAPPRQWIAAAVIELCVGLADSLYRNVLLGLMVLVLTGVLLQLNLFQTTLIIMLGYVGLLALASLNRKPDDA